MIIDICNFAIIIGNCGGRHVLPVARELCDSGRSDLSAHRCVRTMRDVFPASGVIVANNQVAGVDWTDVCNSFAERCEAPPCTIITY